MYPGMFTDAFQICVLEVVCDSEAETELVSVDHGQGG